MSSKRIVKNIFENTDNDKVAISSESSSKISFKDLKTFIQDISKQLSCRKDQPVCIHNTWKRIRKILVRSPVESPTHIANSIHGKKQRN